MNRVIVFFMVLAHLCLMSCSKTENGLTANFIKGDAVSFTDTIWDVSEKFGEVVKDGISQVVKVNLDENGNITDFTYYDSNGRIKSKTVQKWNGKTIDEVIVYGEDGKQEFSYKYSIEHDKIQKIVTTCTMSSKWESTTTYYYSKNNPDRLDSITEVENGEKDLHTFKYLDDNDSYHEFITYSTGSKSEAIYYFDSDKKLIKEKESYGTTSYSYNELGLCIKKTYSDGIIDEYVYDFDEKGSLIKRITFVTNESRNATEMMTRHIEYK